MLHAVDHMDDGTPINLTVSIDEEKVNHPKTPRYSLGKEVNMQSSREWMRSYVSCQLLTALVIFLQLLLHRLLYNDNSINLYQSLNFHT